MVMPRGRGCQRVDGGYYALTSWLVSVSLSDDGMLSQLCSLSCKTSYVASGSEVTVFASSSLGCAEGCWDSDGDGVRGVLILGDA